MPINNARKQPIPVICLAGPTGAGKTALAIELANSLGAEIINADSRQLYADFPVITAQPTAAEQAGIPHHLYGILPTTEKTTAGQWADQAATLAADIAGRGKMPLLVGGTGLYFQAILRGIAQIPDLDQEVVKRLEQRFADEGGRALYQELANLDSDYARCCHPNNRQRLLRALAVCQSTGKSFTWWHRNAMPAPLCAGPLLFLDYPLDQLARRLDARIDVMLDAGAIKEAKLAWQKCQDPDAPGWSGIGCAEILAWLLGQVGFEECRRQWLANTRAYAKRQLTWFRGQAEAIALEAGPGKALQKALEEIEKY